MQSLATMIQVNYDRRKASIRTPQYVVDLTETIPPHGFGLRGRTTPWTKCNSITEAIVVVGGNQDELVGESRMAVKVLRQRAGLAVAADPRTAEIAKEIRRRTRQVSAIPPDMKGPDIERASGGSGGRPACHADLRRRGSFSSGTVESGNFRCDRPSWVSCC